MKRQHKINWLALARESIVRSGFSPSCADEIINKLTGDHLDIEPDDRDWAYETMDQVQFQHAKELGES